MMKEMNRHEMREAAFMLTFERIFIDQPLDMIIENANETITLNDTAINLFKGIDEKKEIIDTQIKKYLKDWSILRISKVSLAVLRVAMYEIMFCDDVDTDVAISEAVIIAQDYTL
ncbi:MAG: transcription antitermination factor NusB, partial [Oscillospiraceae bacterium]